ncbi:sodium:solute symporter, partial [candidate division KSB1 bacterium]
MLEAHRWLSIIPPVFAIILAIKTRQVYISLFLGILMGTTILKNGNPLTGLREAIEVCVRVFENNSNTKVIIFSALIGAIIAFTQRSGGVNGFVNFMTERKFINTRKGAELLAFIIGCVIFIESSITSLIAGTISRPLFDKFKIPREKLAYICDSTSAPICSLIPINAWGAFLLTLLENQEIKNPVQEFLKAVPLNFYSIFAVLIVLFTIITRKDFGPMKKAEKRAEIEGKVLRDGAVPMVSREISELKAKESIKYKSINLVIPVVVMIGMMFVSLLITGNGNLTSGSGSTSVLWSVLTALFVAAVMYKVQKIMSIQEIIELFFRGVGGIISIAFLMVFAFAIGNICNSMGTGPYIAEITKDILNPIFLPCILFLVTCFIAFSTGTSWGTWAIMFPIGIGIAKTLNLNLTPLIAAMLGGGVFGDHCSPISDTTIVASIASASDHIDHVNTQLPYAITSASISIVLY